jgi:hypothetical protein
VTGQAKHAKGNKTINRNKEYVANKGMRRQR